MYTTLVLAAGVGRRGAVDGTSGGIRLTVSENPLTTVCQEYGYIWREPSDDLEELVPQLLPPPAWNHHCAQRNDSDIFARSSASIRQQ